jgi:hypothetical protein
LNANDIPVADSVELDLELTMLSFHKSVDDFPLPKGFDVTNCDVNTKK